jgi:acetyl esterase/lipase
MRFFLTLLLCCCALFTVAEDTTALRKLSDLPYRPDTTADAYAKERCKLDLFLPPAEAGKSFPVLVWFHGGGLEEGNRLGFKKMAASLVAQGIAVVMVDYRLSPKATYPAYVEDAAAAVAWTHAHIAEYGGDAKRVFVGGHSAGGYLAAMVALDPRWLTAAGMKPSDLAGAVPVSGQMATHYTIRKERGLPKEVEIIDEAAPLAHARKDAPRLLFIAADKDMHNRVDENQRMVAALRAAGHAVPDLLVVPERDHSTIMSKMIDAEDPGRKAMVAFILR